MKKTYLVKIHNYKNVLHTGLSLLLFMLAQQAYSQELSIDEFITSILKNNPGVFKILTEKDIATGSLQASYGIDDATLSSSLNLSHTEPDKVFGSEPDKSNNTNLNLSYNRLFSNTGTRFSLGYNNLYTERTPTNIVGTQYYQPSFTVKLTQPLLKNAGGIQDQLNIKLSELNLKLSGLSSQENLESYITQLASLYVDWYLAGRELNISREVHLQSIEQEKLTRTKVRRQVIESYELLRSQEIREDYFSRWQQAKGRFSGLARQIQYQMNLNKPVTDDKLTPRNPNDSQLLSFIQTSLREPDYLENSSRLKAILDFLKEQQTIILDAKDNAQSSDLNLSVGYTRHGIDQQLNDAHSSSLNKDDYSVMLEYKLPLGNRQASGDYQSQRAKKRQIELDTQQQLLNAKANLANLQIQSSQLKVALKSINRKIILGQKKLNKEQRLYRIGKLDLFELLRDQTSHLESRLNRERLYTQQLTLQLKIGELLDRNLETYSSILNSETNATSGEQ